MQVSWQSLEALKPSKIAIAKTYVIFFASCVLFINFHAGRLREVLRRKDIHKEVSSFALKVKVTHSDVPLNFRKSLKNTESI